jgi:hypothetical protein
MPDERYSADNPEDRRYSDEPGGRRNDDRGRDDDRGRYADRDFRSGENIPNYLTQAILVTLCCCWPFGIAAIVNAAKVNTLAAQGNYEAAQEASDAAKKWCTVAFILGLISNGLIVGVQILSAGGRH